MESALYIIMALTIVVLIGALITLRHQYYSREETRAAWQAALLRTAEELHEVLKRLRRKPNWAQTFCELMQEEFQAAGGVVYFQNDANPDEAAPSMHIVCGTGCCADWASRLDEADDTAAQAFHPAAPKDFFWSHRPLIYAAEKLEDWLPPGVENRFQEMLVAPLLTQQGHSFLILLRTDDAPRFTKEEQVRLQHCVDIADAGFQALRTEDERRQMEAALNNAHEEGMLQISTGIIHNIGNGITVIQIALERLQSGEFETIRELAQVIEQEILPEFQQHLDAGDLQEFLLHDPQGREYIAALQELITQIPKLLKEHECELDFVVEKFRSVTEIITLQQQFIGELGTENVVAVSTLMRDVMKMCQEPLEQRNIQLKESFRAKGRILVDPAMLRHILLLIIKHAIDSASATRRAEPMIRVSTEKTENEENDSDDKSWVTITVADNGAGAEIDLSEEDLTADRQSVDDRSRDLFFCQRRIRKYGGRMTISSDYGHGTKVSIHLPSYEESDDANTDAPGN